jgi:hypothetical protein
MEIRGASPQESGFKQPKNYNIRSVREASKTWHHLPTEFLRIVQKKLTKGVLTCTILTHSLTLSSSPRTYIIPGVPPLLSNAKQSCFFAAALRAATFLRDVMWCVRISAWYIVRKDAAGEISEGCMVVWFKTMVGAVSMPSDCGFGS